MLRLLVPLMQRICPQCGAAFKKLMTVVGHIPGGAKHQVRRSYLRCPHCDAILFMKLTPIGVRLIAIYSIIVSLLVVCIGMFPTLGRTGWTSALLLVLIGSFAFTVATWGFKYAVFRPS